MDPDRPASDVDALLDAVRASEQAPTLDELAAAAHVSRFHLSRLLRDRLGFPLRDYLAALKVERGIDALVAGHPVTRSQHEGGHESPSSYARSFARHTGLAPSRYRAQMASLAAHLLRHMDRADPFVALYRAFDPAAHRQPHPLTLRVTGALPGSALFAALHGEQIVRAAPDLGIALLGTAEHTVTEIPDGTYYAMVVELPRDRGVRPYFTMVDNRRQLRREPITFPLTEPTEVTLALRDRLPGDPPITPNLPKLFLDGLLGRVAVQDRNPGQATPDGVS